MFLRFFLFLIILSLASNSVVAQGSEHVDMITADSVSKRNNEIFVYLSVGQGRPITPLSPGVQTVNRDDFSIPKFNSISAGLIYGFSEKTSVKGTFSYDSYRNFISYKSWTSQNYRVEVCGMVDLIKTLDLNNMIPDLSLAAGVGLSSSVLTTKEYGFKDFNYGLVYSLSPNYKLNDKLVVSLDYCFRRNFRQHLNWDGSQTSRNSNLAGQMDSFSIGFSYLLSNSK